MPELPDVAVYCEALHRHVVGHELTRVRLANPFLLRSVTPPIDAVVGRTVQGIRRIGKRIVLDFGDELFLVEKGELQVVVKLARGGEARVADLMAELGLAQSTVSAHMACLRECGLVTGRPQGRQVFYSLARPELMDLLAAAETLLAATGNAVALCPNYGTGSSCGDMPGAAGTEGAVTSETPAEVRE